MSNRDYDDFDDAEFEREMDERKDARTRYLAGTEAIVTPLAAMALWVAIWEAQTGKQVRSYDGSYRAETVTILEGTFKGAIMDYEGAKNMGISESDMRKHVSPSYDQLGWNHWMPTVSGYGIPEGYGSAALQLLVLPDVVDQPLTPATNDRRDGWEWGHTAVYVLAKGKGPHGFVASSNNNFLGFSKDVVKLARSTSIRELIALLSATNVLGDTSRVALSA
jgi:hypothetical protein